MIEAAKQPERRYASESAEQERTRLQAVLDSASIATWFYDPGRDVVRGDERMANLFGLPVPEGPLEMWLASVVQDDRSRVAEEYAAGLDGAPYDTRYRVSSGGETRWLHARASLLPSDDGAVQMVGICEDITREETLAAGLAETEQRLATERHAAAESLRLAGERLQMALAISNATSFDWDRITDAVQWSGLAPLGISPEEMGTGDAFLRRVHPDDRSGLDSVHAQALASGEAYAHEFRAVWADGSTRWLRTAGRALVDPTGATRFLGVNTDVTDRKLAEEGLLQAEKLAAVGRMASVISHEINNPLAAVTNLLYVVRASPTLANADREYLEIADRELARVSQITAQTLQFHRHGDRVTEIDVDVLAQELVSLYRTRLSASDVKIRLDLQEGVRFRAHEGEIRQVLNNLIGNAFDAMRKGGTLRIRSRYTTDNATGRKAASITIADNGRGIPVEVRDHVFEAFYSTKGINGTGLGLWISKRIVTKHGGNLTFRTSTGPHSGTAFRVSLPVEPAALVGG